MNSQRTGYVWWCAATILLSAFLLFQVQPMISRMILPWFGGGPGVWTTCMLFFQIVLLLGYGYAHYLFRLKNQKVATIVHCCLLAAALISLPIEPGKSWKPDGSEEPTARILFLLAAKVGLPYFLLSSTGPLLQAWFARVAPGTSPYRLYALSNIGSLAGLLTYPFVFEPNFGTSSQGFMWSISFAVFALLCGTLAIFTSRVQQAREVPTGEDAAKTETAAEDSPPGLIQRLLWLIYPTLGSILLLSITHHVCQDVAAAPFLWVAPLSLYLLTFIICFDSESWYLRRTIAILVVLMIMAVSVKMAHGRTDSFFEDARVKLAESPQLVSFVKRLEEANNKYDDWFDELSVEAGCYLGLLFFACMTCHGELVRRKPSASHLTSFYMMTSAGGALGGMFVGLVCPHMFPENWELNIAIVAAFIAAATVISESFAEGRSTPWYVAIPVWSTIFLVMLFVVFAQFSTISHGHVAIGRNFYGVLRVSQIGAPDEWGARRALYNGRILHGYQSLDPNYKRIPNSYYDTGSGIGIAMKRYNHEEPLKIAVVGLGTGTMAAFIQEGESVKFYEINPMVKDFAMTHFSYLTDCPGKAEVVLGDARLSMDREAPNNFDVIVLDAFSGDAIPVHLLTLEAFEIYFRHLKPNGILAVHISNRHLDLTPVVAGLSDHFQRSCIKVINQDGNGPLDAGSDWMLVTSNEQFLSDSVVEKASVEYRSNLKPIQMWTDQFSNLMQIMK